MQESVSFRYLEVNQIGMVLTNSNSVLDGQLAGLHSISNLMNWKGWLGKKSFRNCKVKICLNRPPRVVRQRRSLLSRNLIAMDGISIYRTKFIDRVIMGVSRRRQEN